MNYLSYFKRYYKVNFLWKIKEDKNYKDPLT